MKVFAPNATDFYKTGHIFQYPDGSELVYSNFTNRSDRLAKMTKDFDNKVVNVGTQGALKEIAEMWDETFFKVPKVQAVKRYQRRCDNALGPGAVPVNHIAALHDLGYLPIEVKSLPEGSRVNIRVPSYTIKNTMKSFYWVTNYLETILSDMTWKTQTTATIAFEYKRMLNKFAELTGGSKEFVMWQGHDFSMRGMSGIEDATRSSFGHLCSFAGTDTITAIDYAEDYYGANSDTELVGGSVPATEHSVMCAGGKTSERDTFNRLITETYPSGVVSIVSDTWDFFHVLTNIAPSLKTEILNRQPNALGLAKVVFRPDSGDPTKIVCGDPQAPIGSPQYKGAIQCLWETFGGTTNSNGFKQLNPRVGLIYGDSITLQRAEAILSGLAERGFASDNIVFGIGSFTYNYNTRDTFGSAIKATYHEMNGQGYNLFKDPVTDTQTVYKDGGVYLESGTKKSACGLLRVEKVEKDFVLFDNQTWEQEQQGELKTIFKDGKFFNQTTLAEIRKRLDAEI